MSLFDALKHHLRLEDSSAHDARLQRLADSAVREYFQYTAGDVPADLVAAAAELGDDAVNGIVLMAQADFDGDPEKRPAYRRAAQALWDPYRVDMGV